MMASDACRLLVPSASGATGVPIALGRDTTLRSQGAGGFFHVAYECPHCLALGDGLLSIEPVMLRTAPFPARCAAIRRHACGLGFEGVVSKTIDAPYASGNRGPWRKSKRLNRQEFVVVGWTDPEGSRPHLGALLLGYYTDGAKWADWYRRSDG